MRNNDLFIHYSSNGSINVQGICSEDELFVTAIFGEFFGLVDGVGKEFAREYVGEADSFLSFVKEYGIEEIENANGAFIGVVYEKKKKILHIYNDRFGLIPFYITSDKVGGYYISTTVRSFKGIINLEPDYVGIGEYLSFDYCFENRTCFKNIKYMLPGQHIIFFAEQGAKTKIYYNLSKEEAGKEKTKKDYMDEFDALYCHAIDIRRARKNIIGLTGGLDSRLILGILGGKDTYTYNFGNLGSGDEVGASALAKEYNTKHCYMQFDHVNVINDARDIILLSDGLCPWERFYVLNSAKEKEKIIDGVEISGMGGDAITGQKSNFTGLIPFMSLNMSESIKLREEEKLINNITRGRIKTEDKRYYGRILTETWSEIKKEYLDALRISSQGKTFGNFTMRLKLRTIERHTTMASMWLTGHFVPIRFPFYDYAVIEFFNRLPQKYRYGQNLYIDLIAEKYDRVAKAPHSETGCAVDRMHIFRADYITVKNYALQKMTGKKTVYTNSFGFVNDAILSCDIKELIPNQKGNGPQLFNLSDFGTIDSLVEQAKESGGKALVMLKNIIQVSLLNELYFNDTIKLF